MKTVLGLDIGTTRTRAVAVDESGQVVAASSAGYPLLSPRTGWSEQDPADWWQASREVLGRVAADVGSDVGGLGLTGQMHGSVFLDENGDVIRPALLENDQRTALQSDQIAQRIGAERLIEITGNPALTTFQAPKILWLRDVEPVQYRHVRHVLLPKDYVRLMLTGELATDVSDASGTLLFDVRRRAWSHQILAALDIPPEWLPAVFESAEAACRLLPSLASELGLPSGITVAAGAGDRAAAAIAAGIVESGRISSSIGSSGMLFAHADQLVIDPSGRLQAFCDAVPHRWALMAITLSAGASLSWWRNILGATMTYDQLATLASSAPPGAEGLFFLPYLMGARTPHLDPGGRGAFVGLRAHHTKAHLTRAVMEGVVFSLRDGLEVMRGLGLDIRHIRTTGSARRSPFWRQLQADIFNLPVERTVVDEGPAYGAALLAGVTSGIFESVHQATQRVRVREAVNEPDAEQVRRYEGVYATYRQLYPALYSGASSALAVQGSRYNPARGA
jgi:xylulokinase